MQSVRPHNIIFGSMKDICEMCVRSDTYGSDLAALHI
jgi:hypothetical protein